MVEISEQKNVKAFLVGRNKLFREGLKRLLTGSQFEIAGEADEVGGIAEGGTAVHPHILLLDLPAEADEAAEDLERLQALFPGAPVVVLTDTMSSQLLVSCLSAGASGYLIKDISVEALMQSLRLILLGEKVFPTHLAALLVSSMGSFVPTTSLSSKATGLSAREMEILQCLVRGDSNKMIANRLSITEATVKVHMKALLRKIDASNRTQAAIWGLNHGIGAGAGAFAGTRVEES